MISNKRFIKTRAHAIKDVLTDSSSTDDVISELETIYENLTVRQVQSAARAVKACRRPVGKAPRVIASVISKSGSDSFKEVERIIRNIVGSTDKEVIAGVKSARAKGQYTH